LPIKDLRNGAASIGQGNFNLVLPPYEVAELEELRGSLNAMALQLKDRENTLLEQQALLNDEVSNRARMEAKLRELNEMLEEKVLERTRQLSQTNEKLREEIQAKEHSQSQYQALVEQTPAVTYVSQFQPEFKIKFISPQIEKLIGWTPDQLIARPGLFSACIHPDDLPRIRELIQEMHTDQHIYHIEYRIISRNGEMIWVQDDAMVLPQVAGEPQSVQGVIMNINVRKETEERMLYTAFHDPLTGLKNRTFLYKELETLIDNPSGLNDHSFALLHLDIDRFKVVNDSLGHRFGDRLLIAIADRLQTLLQPNTILARLSGDEFAILIKTISPESEATHLTERIIADLRNPFNLDGRIVYTSVSIGIAINNAEYLTPDDVMRDVDIAMYRAKSRGRGCYEHFTTPLRDQMINRHQIEEMLRTAIDAEEFEVHYQPIVHLLENRLVGFEALVRWNSPQHGMISPGQFLPIAEETGMIHAIDRWVMRTACQQLQTWHTTNMVAPDVSMSVNLSGSRLQQTGVIEMIADILAETRLNPALLKIEITESVFISTTDEMVSLLNQIRALGVQLQIDDFGTGYSSLSYLQRFPINAIKIDRSFISRIDGENSGTEIVQAIILLARELGMGTVAEGIETPAQFEWLRNANCQFGQGFLMYRPLDKETAGKLLASINA
jgi:diguanylate cyclase (GGDEF)-like protein/PAS domain S-box-containing protein